MHLMSFLREWWAQAVDFINALWISGRQESGRTDNSGRQESLRTARRRGIKIPRSRRLWRPVRASVRLPAYSGRGPDTSFTGEYASYTYGPWPARPTSVPRSSSQHHHESSTRVDLESLPHLKHLKVAFLSGLERLDGVHTNVISELPTLPHLTSLEIKGYNLQWRECHQKSWQSCTVMTNLQALSLDSVHFGRDPGLHVLAGLQFLTLLSISNANIAFPPVQHSESQAKLTCLQSLNISHCRIAGDTACMCCTLGYFTGLTSLKLSNLCTSHPVQGLHHLAALTNLQELNLGGTNTEFSKPDWLHALTSLTLLTCTQSSASATQLESYMSKSSGSCCTVVLQQADTTRVEPQHVFVHNSEEVEYSSYYYEDEGYNTDTCTDSCQGRHIADAMQKDKLRMAALLHHQWLDTCNSIGTDYDSHISDDEDHSLRSFIDSPTDDYYYESDYWNM